MKAKSTFLAFAIIIMGTSSSLAQDPDAKIIPQSDAPVKILSYTARYQQGTTYQKQGIHHWIEYQNATHQNIVAVRIGFVSFDIWNEFLDRMGGVAMEKVAPGGKKRGEWIANAYAEFSFLTGVAYVNTVRFENGQIWSANLDDVVKELQKIEENFDVSRLKKKEGEK